MCYVEAVEHAVGDDLYMRYRRGCESDFANLYIRKSPLYVAYFPKYGFTFKPHYVLTGHNIELLFTLDKGVNIFLREGYPQGKLLRCMYYDNKNPRGCDMYICALSKSQGITFWNKRTVQESYEYIEAIISREKSKKVKWRC